MAAAAWEDDWELCNDDGFVYKRKRRRKEPAIAAKIPAPDPPDPEAEEKKQRARKKRALMKLRDKYQKEIRQWEHLLHTLRDMEDRSLTLPQERCPSPVVPPIASPSESECQPLVDSLLLQAEAQEAIIQDISNLCDVAESMCKSHEECFNLSLFDLPVWATPRALMASLSDE